MNCDCSGEVSGYLRFQRTGLEVVDDILATIERAGDAYHHTSQWQEKTDWLDGKSCDDLIDEKIAIARTQLSAIQPSGCQCEACLSIPKHDSDCSVHNMPAYPNEPCNCSLSSAEVLVEALREIANSSHSSAGGSRIANEALESYEAKLLQKEG